VEECVEEILRDYRRELERLREPPPPDPVEGVAGARDFRRGVG
jgi:hypothetical protein